MAASRTACSLSVRASSRTSCQGTHERAGGGCPPALSSVRSSCQRLPVTLTVIRPTLSLSTWIFVPVFGTITLVYGVRSS